MSRLENCFPTAFLHQQLGEFFSCPSVMTQEAGPPSPPPATRTPLPFPRRCPDIPPYHLRTHPLEGNRWRPAMTGLQVIPQLGAAAAPTGEHVRPAGMLRSPQGPAAGVWWCSHAWQQGIEGPATAVSVLPYSYPCSGARCEPHRSQD